jgi:hypothetical protein
MKTTTKPASTPVETEEQSVEREVTRRADIVLREKAFRAWLNKALTLRGAFYPPPFPLDDYEIRQATEQGLY